MDSKDFVAYDASASVTTAVRTRRSLRAFTDQSVETAVIKHILETAARAPSGTNMQPWQTYVLTGERKERLSKVVCDAFDTDARSHTGEVRYYPEQWFDPYLSRRRKIGWDLYTLLDIGRGDKEKMHKQHRRNFLFFDAPVGMMFTINRNLATGSWLDYGMFLQNVMLLAREAGLHTCPQAAWSDFHAVVRPELELHDDEVVVCGMALGYADSEAIENTLVSERESIDSSVTFLDSV